MNYVLGLDIGTTNIKALLLERKTGRRAGLSHISYEIDLPKSGWAECSAELWYDCCSRCIQALTSNTGITGQQIDAVAFSGQMHGLVALDENGQQIGKAILHCDTRSQVILDEFREGIGDRAFHDSLMNPAYPGFLALSLLYQRRYCPEEYKRIAHVMLPKDYLLYRFTDSFVTDYSDASGTLAFDIRTGRWSMPVLEFLGLPGNCFPQICESCGLAGYLSRAAAADTGLREGTPVFCGGGDAVMQSIGNGMLDETHGIINIGTSGQVLFYTRELKPRKNNATNTYCGCTRDAWLSMGAIMSAGSAVRWASRILREPDLNILNEKMRQVPPGCGTTLFLPQLIGERTPYLRADLRGAWLGLSLDTTSENMARAVIEGVSNALYRCYWACKENGFDAEAFYVSGGGARSELWCQILSDLFNRPMMVTAESEQAALGAAMCAEVGIGDFCEIAEAASTCISTPERIYMPNPAAFSIYQENYRRYCAAVERLL